MLRLRYFATEPVNPCAVCGEPMVNHDFWGTPPPTFHPGVYFATVDGQWVCSYCCGKKDEPLWQRSLAELADENNEPFGNRCPCQGVNPPFKMTESDDWENDSILYHKLLGMCYACDCGQVSHWCARLKLNWPDVYEDLHARGRL